MSRTNSLKSCDPAGPEDSERWVHWQNYIFTLKLWGSQFTTKLRAIQPPRSPAQPSCLKRSLYLKVFGFSRHQQQNQMLDSFFFFFKHLWLKGATTFCSVCTASCHLLFLWPKPNTESHLRPRERKEHRLENVRVFCTKCSSMTACSTCN